MLNSMPENASSGNALSLPPFPQRRAAAGGGEGPRMTINPGASLRRHWVWALAVFLVILACGGYVVRKKGKPVYLTTSVVYISPAGPKVASGGTEVTIPYDSYLQDQIQMVTRYDVIAAAIAKLPSWIRGRSGPALPYEIQVLQKGLQVQRVGETSEMSIALEAPVPKGLAEVVNTVTDTYVEKEKDEEFSGRDEQLNTLHQEEDRLEKQMDQRLAEQSQLMQQLGVATVPAAEGASDPYDASVERLREQLAGARLQREAAEAQLSAEQKGASSSGTTELDAAADQAIAADPGLAAIRGALTARQVKLMEEMNGLRPSHPTYQKDSAELASIETRLNQLQQKAETGQQGKMREEVMRTRTIELQLEQELQAKTHSAAAAAPLLQRAAELGPEIDSLQKASADIDARIRDLEVENSSPGSIHVASRAVTPLGPEKSKLKMFLIAMFMMSLLLAVAVPIGIDLLDSRIYTASDVERVVGFHPLGVLLDHDEVRQEIEGEYYFRLAAGIDHAVRSAGARTFLFTSPAHGSGTSTVVQKLSAKLSSLDLRTLTVVASGAAETGIPHDASSVRPLRLLQQRNRRNDELRRPALTAIAETPQEGQEMPGAGSMDPVARALNQAGQQYDVVLIDANPLLISANTEYLARVSDATVLVVRSSSTTRQELTRSARLLERLEVAGVAVVLNKVGRERADAALRRDLVEYERSLHRGRGPSGPDNNSPGEQATA